MIPLSYRLIVLPMLLLCIQAQQVHSRESRTRTEISDLTFQISKKVSLQARYAAGHEMGERHPVSLEIAATRYATGYGAGDPHPVSLETAATGYATGYGAGEQHPVIHRAIRALEAAKAYIEGATHDFCGHRVAALDESNLALNQLGLAIICDKRRDRTSGVGITVPASASPSDGLFPERHRLIRQAINSLEAARRDLSNASHDYCGHRVEALEAISRAIAQLKLALDCDKD